MQRSLAVDPDERATCSELLRLEYIQADGFASRFIDELRIRVAKETEGNPLLRVFPSLFFLPHSPSNQVFLIMITLFCR